MPDTIGTLYEKHEDTAEHRARAKRIVSGIIGFTGWKLTHVRDDQGISQTKVLWTYADVWKHPDTGTMHAQSRTEEEVLWTRPEEDVDDDCQDSTDAQEGASVDDLVYQLNRSGENVLVDLDDDNLYNALSQDLSESDSEPSQTTGESDDG